MMAMKELSPYRFLIVHTISPSSSRNTGDMVRVPDSSTEYLSGDKEAPFCLVQEVTPKGKLRSVEQVREVVVLTVMVVGWMEPIIGEAIWKRRNSEFFIFL